CLFATGPLFLISLLLFLTKESNYSSLGLSPSFFNYTFFRILSIGTLGLLINAKSKGNIDELKPLFQQLISNKRYYSLQLLNAILLQSGETTLEVE
ncbi:MAG: DUF3368 domain-containing protein, partial [Saprospiraceae bacterium]|nr:DUF3368 domain-containing protein [Saprospiraceae bacterium]